MAITEAELLHTAGTAQASDDPSAGPLRIGQLIHQRYVVKRLLGEGGMGAVYEAEHQGIGRRVAIKVLATGIAHDTTVLRRFMAEARAAGRARHRHIIEMIDYGVEASLHWMAMEYLDGESLEAFIAREAPAEPRRVVEILDPLCRALSYVHALGIVHRDLKPANIFLAREVGADDVVPKLLDFGIAKDLASAKLTSTGSIIGTPAYMPPEQIESSKDISPAADQYAMGCVAYELLSGRLPLDADTLPLLLVQKMTRSPAELSSLRPELPPALCAAVMRALAKRPGDRHPDVEAFRAALCEALASNSASTATGAPRPRASQAPTREIPRATTPALGPRRMVGAVTVGFAVTALALGLGMRARSRPTESAQRPAPAADAPMRPVQVPATVTSRPPTPVPTVVAPPNPAPRAVAVDAGVRRTTPSRTRDSAPLGRRLRVDPTNPL